MVSFRTWPNCRSLQQHRAHRWYCIVRKRMAKSRVQRKLLEDSQILSLPLRLIAMTRSTNSFPRDTIDDSCSLFKRSFISGCHSVRYVPLTSDSVYLPIPEHLWFKLNDSKCNFSHYSSFLEVWFMLDWAHEEKPARRGVNAALRATQ